MLEGLILITLMALGLIVCISPSWLAMIVMMQLLMQRYERARAARTSLACMNVFVLAVGALVGVATYATGGLMILATPVFGVAALFLERRNSRRRISWPELPHARVV